MKIIQTSRSAAMACALAAATSSGVVGAVEIASREENQCRTIHANVPWQGTGISVGPGQFVCVGADGLWSHGTQGIQAITPFYGPGGFGKDEPDTVPEVVSRTGALIGRIGMNARFLIERQLCFVPTASGELQLSMNDEPGAFDNNRGSMHVRIVKWADTRWFPGRITLNPQACGAR